MARQKINTGPAPGTAYAFPLGDGRFSVCRVLLDASSPQAQEWGLPVLLVACSDWIGNEIPCAEEQEAALRPILRLTHHSWDNILNIFWVPVRFKPPQDFIPIGTIEPTKEEQETPCWSLASWETLSSERLLQWRWDNERDTVLAEDERKMQEDVSTREKAQKARKAYLKQISLAELQIRQFLPNWKRVPSAKATRLSRQLMTDTVQQLISLGTSASEGARLSVLKQCIESFNHLDAQMQHFIETSEREDILHEFEAIVHACGLGHLESPADEWREW